MALPSFATPSAAAEPACVDGFSLVAPTAMILPDDVYTLKPGKAIVAGGKPAPNVTRIASVASYKAGSGWTRQTAMPLGFDSSFVAIESAPGSRPWAVGYGRGWTWLSPLVARQRSDGSWRRVSIKAPGPYATLTDVSAPSGSRAWAVGFRLTANGTPRPWATTWSGGKWRSKSPALAGAERGTLTGVSATKRGGTWVVGSVIRGGIERPYMAKRVGTSWKRMDLDRFGAGTLTAITVPEGTDGWAVGYRDTAAGISPLVLHRDAKGWREVTPPQLQSPTILLDVSVSPAGRVAVAGSTRKADGRRMRGLVAERNGSTWDVHTTKLSVMDMGMTGIDGDPSDGGWVVGRDIAVGMAGRTCTVPAGPTVSKAGKQAVRKERKAAIAKASALSTADEEHLAEPPPAPRADLAAAPRLEISGTASVTMKDKAKAVGLPLKATTYGAVVRDFDGNGRPDIFLGGHAGQATLFLRVGSTFKAHPDSFGSGDRHGCAAADVDGSGLPDLYCNFGGGRGLGVKSNQLWLDPGGPDRRIADDAGGVVSPLGRGRAAIFLDVDADGRKDLVLGQQPDRLDGLPSLNGVYLRDGKASFGRYRGANLPNGLGAHGFDSGDVDRDGRTDLLLIYRSPRATGTTSGIKLLRNTPSGFRNVTSRYGIKGIGERDAELVRLDGDNKPDLVQLSGDRIRISLQRDGRFRKVFERRIDKAMAMATGDVDGDGDRDIYVLRQKDSKATKDLVLFNRDGGRSYVAVKAPSRAGGTADDVYPIDHDGNGLTDFLTLNGKGKGKGPGPLQLISFYR